MSKKTYGIQLAKEGLRILKKEEDLGLKIQEVFSELKVAENIQDFETEEYFEIIELENEFNSENANLKDLEVNLTILLERIKNRRY